VSATFPIRVSGVAQTNCCCLRWNFQVGELHWRGGLAAAVDPVLSALLSVWKNAMISPLATSDAGMNFDLNACTNPLRVLLMEINVWASTFIYRISNAQENASARLQNLINGAGFIRAGQDPTGRLTSRFSAKRAVG